MADEEKKYSLSLPGEWAVQKLLGPMIDEIGKDLGKLYSVGRDRILNAAARKVDDLEDGKVANLRVAKEVLWSGSFSDSEICVEYFGGILASTRSTDGTDDSAIQFLQLIKSLSSNQLKLHYALYAKIRKESASFVGVNDDRDFINQLEKKLFTVDIKEPAFKFSIELETDLLILHQMKLLDFKLNVDLGPEKGNRQAFALTATKFGVMLFCAAHNKLRMWRTFQKIEFEMLSSVSLPGSFELH